MGVAQLAASLWEPLRVKAETPEDVAAAEDILLAFIGASGAHSSAAAFAEQPVANTSSC